MMKDMQHTETFNIRPIGFIHSKLNDLKDCPLQEAKVHRKCIKIFPMEVLDATPVIDIKPFI